MKVWKVIDSFEQFNGLPEGTRIRYEQAKGDAYGFSSTKKDKRFIGTFYKDILDTKIIINGGGYHCMTVSAKTFPAFYSIEYLCIEKRVTKVKDKRIEDEKAMVEFLLG